MRVRRNSRTRIVANAVKSNQAASVGTPFITFVVADEHNFAINNVSRAPS